MVTDGSCVHVHVFDVLKKSPQIPIYLYIEM